MPGTNKREAAYATAREALMKAIADRGLSYMDDTERGDALRGIVRRLEREHPELDGHLARRLMGEGMRREPEATDSPPEGELER